MRKRLDLPAQIEVLGQDSLLPAHSIGKRPRRLGQFSKKFTVAFPVEQFLMMNDCALRSGRSMACLVRDVMETYLRDLGDE